MNASLPSDPKKFCKMFLVKMFLILSVMLTILSGIMGGR